MTVSLDSVLNALRERGVSVRVQDGLPEHVTGVADDSRKVEEGFLFCAVEGTGVDGHDYIEQAVQNGASAAIVTKESDVSIPQIVVDDDRLAVGIAASVWFGNPGDHMVLVGITGTNGKSTTAAVVRHLLNEEEDVGLVGTLGAFDGSGNALYLEGLTTPGPIQIHETLAWMRSRGTRAVVMETSSHALEQKRVDGLSFSVAVFTNLSQDHLDYHASFEEYLAAKARLADLVESGGAVVVNADAPQWEGLKVGAGVKRISFGIEAEADIRATNLSLDAAGSKFHLEVLGEKTQVTAPLIGLFNVSNILGAVGVGVHLGLSVDVISERLRVIPQVDGRMEAIVSDGWVVLRDYAHTPDALERALTALRPLTRGRLIVLFGCGGDRDRGKRPLMGKVAAEKADWAFVTSDNPRTEAPDAIIDEIVSGMEPGGFERIVDRREAIKRAVEQLQEGDCLLLAGKGHETYQVLGTERFPFDEPQIVLDAAAGRTR